MEQKGKEQEDVGFEMKGLPPTLEKRRIELIGNNEKQAKFKVLKSILNPEELSSKLGGEGPNIQRREAAEDDCLMPVIKPEALKPGEETIKEPKKVIMKKAASPHKSIKEYEERLKRKLQTFSRPLSRPNVINYSKIEEEEGQERLRPALDPRPEQLDLIARVVRARDSESQSQSPKKKSVLQIRSQHFQWQSIERVSSVPLNSLSHAKDFRSKDKAASIERLSDKARKQSSGGNSEGKLSNSSLLGDYASPKVGTSFHSLNNRLKKDKLKNSPEPKKESLFSRKNISKSPQMLKRFGQNQKEIRSSKESEDEGGEGHFKMADLVDDSLDEISEKSIEPESVD